MKHTKEISDQQLTQFLSGTASPEQEAEVYDFAAAADENAEDLLNIALAIREQQRTRQRRVAVRRRYAAAAVLALLAVVGAGYLFRPADPGAAGPSTPVTAGVATADSAALGPRQPTPAQAQEVQRQQQPHAYRMERRERLTAAQGAIHHADSTPADTHSHCLKSITL